MTALPSLAIDAHRAALVRFVASRVDVDAAEDIVHDVFVRAYARREQLRDETKLLPWLYQMTRNAIADHHRARRPSEELPEDVAMREPEDRAMQELASCLTPLIEQLPEHYRDAVQLSEIDGVSLQETANRLGISLSGAKSRVQRARTKLQEALLQCCHVELDHRGSIRDYACRGAQCRAHARPS
jgi:RNA polymerase sigma-70 factor, ECF subfamily